MSFYRAALVFSLFLTALVSCGDNRSSENSAGAGDAGVDAPSDPISRGRAAVEKRGCPNCHQDMDATAGTLSGRLDPIVGTTVYPANITPDPTYGIGTWSDDDIGHAVRDGYAPGLAWLCRQMAPFSRMGDDEILDIIAYLRSLPPVPRAIPKSHCPPIKP